MPHATTPVEPPLPMRLSRMIMGAWVPQAIYTAVSLGLPDQLAGGKKGSRELAEAAGAPAGNVRRLLRALVALELCSESEPGVFELTPMGAYLRSDAPDSMRSWALLRGRESIWAGWGRLLDAVRTGRTAPQLMAGKGAFEWLQDDPEGVEIFNQAMAQLTPRHARAIAAAYDFSGIGRIVDVGGGYGALLVPVLAEYPAMDGIVFDLPYCRAGSERLMAGSGLAGRCEFVAGDFFEAVPAGAGAYALKSVIHDWDDEKSIAILRACRAAMSPSARLLLIEPLAPESVGTSAVDAMMVGSDLNMLLMTGGCERTESQYRCLLEAAGFRVARVVGTSSPMSVTEAHPA